jgi:uncharacterized RDD family membrane protein YckC
MSSDGSPPEQPEEAPTSPTDPYAAPPTPPPAGPSADRSVDQGAEKPWSPYPDNWDDLKPGTQGAQDPSAAQNPYAAASSSQSPQSPHSPYGEPAPYGVPPQQPAPGNPYAGASVPTPDYVFGGYASWGSRVVAYLIDGFLGSVAAFPVWIGYGLLVANATTTTDVNGVKQVQFHATAASTLLILVGLVTAVAFFVWNQCLRQGRTGATLGKSLLAIRTVHADMLPIGAGLSFVRYLLNIVNALPCYLGFLWPLWDSHRQTFADKIMTTYVIKAETPQPRVY